MARKFDKEALENLFRSLRGSGRKGPRVQTIQGGDREGSGWVGKTMFYGFILGVVTLVGSCTNLAIQQARTERQIRAEDAANSLRTEYSRDRAVIFHRTPQGVERQIITITPHKDYLCPVVSLDGEAYAAALQDYPRLAPRLVAEIDKAESAWGCVPRGPRDEAAPERRDHAGRFIPSSLRAPTPAARPS